jgi:2-dehydropantoate 2-reductase
VTSITAATPHGPFDLALLTVKTYDTKATIEELMAAAREDTWTHTIIISLQNGVQSEKLLAEAFGPERVVAGTELNPISVVEPGTILLEKWRGGLGLAPVTRGASVERWVQVFEKDVLPTRAYADFRAMKWSKLLLNIIGNASAAILDMNTAEVYADPRLFHLEVEMLREAVDVMRSQGIRPVNLPGYPVQLLARGMRWAPDFVLRPIMRKLVAGGRGEKPPSLLLELRRGRRRSEVGDLNGAVVRAGERTHVSTPVNQTLTEVLSRLVEQRVQWDSIRRQPDVLLAVAAEMRHKARKQDADQG